MTNEEKLAPFIEEFARISSLTFSADRESLIDDFFAGLTRIELDPPGKGEFKEEGPKDDSLRIRGWIYMSDCGRSIVFFKVKLVLCENDPASDHGRKTIFESGSTFTGKI